MMNTEYRIIESLYYIPETNIIVYVSHTRIKLKNIVTFKIFFKKLREKSTSILTNMHSLLPTMGPLSLSKQHDLKKQSFRPAVRR